MDTDDGTVVVDFDRDRTAFTKPGERAFMGAEVEGALSFRCPQQ
jgi:hypothetical protein